MSCFCFSRRKCHEDDKFCGVTGHNLSDNKHLKEILHVIKVALMCIEASTSKQASTSAILKTVLG